MRRADRLFELVLLLRRGLVITALDLSRELEVSERTIYRDIQALILSGVPVEGEVGVGVGYVLRRGFELPPLMFTLEEAKALAL
ncbi:MAG: HTH domain-containing protein, partial [Candidatus Hydrogenedentota bacterium]